MSDSTPIGSLNPGSVRAKASLDDVQQMIKRKLINRFGEKGWGAKSAQDLNNPAVLDPLENVNDVELNDVELEDIDPADIKYATATGDVGQGRPMFNSGERTGGDAGPLRNKEVAKDQVLENVQVMEEVAAEIRADGVARGLTEDQILQELYDAGVGPTDISNYLTENITLIDDFASVKGREAGTNPLGSRVKRRNKKMNVKRDGESLTQGQKDGIKDAIEEAKKEQAKANEPDTTPKDTETDGGDLDNSDGSGTEDIGDGLEGSEGTEVGEEFGPPKPEPKDTKPKDGESKKDDGYEELTEAEKEAIRNSRDGKNPDGSEKKPDNNQKPPPKDPPKDPPSKDGSDGNDGNDGNTTPRGKKPGIIRRAAGYAIPTTVAGGSLLALLAMMNRNGSKSVPPVDGMGGGGNGGGNGGGGGAAALPPVPVRGGSNNRRMTPEEKAMLMRQLAQNSDRFNHNTQNMKSWVR